MASGKILNTENALYGNITRALSGDKKLPKLVALDGGLDTPLQTRHQTITYPVSTATWSAQQGIARNATNWYAINTGSIVKYDLANNILVTNNSPYTGLPAGVDHLGASFIDGGFLYVPAVNWDSPTQSSTVQTIAKYNLSDLTLDSQFDISSQVNCNGSGLALSADGLEILVTSFYNTLGNDQRNTDIYRFNKSTGSFIGVYQLNTPSVGIQSLVLHDGDWFLGSYYASTAINSIYRYDSSFNLITELDPISSSVEMEGVTSYDDVLYFNHFNGSPRSVDLGNLYISNVESKSDPVQFMGNSLILDSNTVLMKVLFKSLINFQSIFDNETYTNNWEAWSELDGDLQYRVDSAQRTTDSASLIKDQFYILAFTWEKVGGNVTIKLGNNGVYVSTNTAGAWKIPPSTGLWLAGKNASNDQGDNLYSDILVFDKVLSDAELLEAYNNFNDFYTPVSSGITLTVAEQGPSFTEVINSTLAAKLNVSISEQGPSFTESLNVTLSSLTIQASITESGPSFTESITADITVATGINLAVAESGPSFTESINANLDVNISSAIAELGPSFTESISISLTKEIQVNVTEFGPSFVENITASIPIKITVNPKNIVRVKRRSNTVIIKHKSNIIRVK